MNKFTVTVMITLVLSLSIVPAIMPAQAEELNKKQIENLLERTYEIRVLLEDEKERLEERGLDTSNRLDRLEGKYAEKVKLLNENGYITTEQLEDDPLKYDLESQREIAEIEVERAIERGITLDCECDNVLYVDTGYFGKQWYWFWNYYPSDTGYDALNFIGDSTTIEAHLEDDYDSFKPVIRVQLLVDGNATFSYDYTYVGNQVDGHSGSASATSTSTQVYTIGELSNVEAGDYTRTNFTVLSLSP